MVLADIMGSALIAWQDSLKVLNKENYGFFRKFVVTENDYWTPWEPILLPWRDKSLREQRFRNVKWQTTPVPVSGTWFCTWLSSCYSHHPPSWFCYIVLVQFSFVGLKPFILTVRALVLLVNYLNWRDVRVCTTQAIISVESHSYTFYDRAKTV